MTPISVRHDCSDCSILESNIILRVGNDGYLLVVGYMILPAIMTQEKEESFL